MFFLKSGMPNIPMLVSLISIIVLIIDLSIIHEFTNPNNEFTYIGIIPMLIFTVCFFIGGIIVNYIDNV